MNTLLSSASKGMQRKESDADVRALDEGKNGFLFFPEMQNSTAVCLHCLKYFARFLLLASARCHNSPYGIAKTQFSSCKADSFIC